MKIIKMPVAQMTAAQLNPEAKGLLQRLADNAADFPAAPATNLTTHSGQLDTQLSELTTMQDAVAAKVQQINASAVSVRADMNTLGDWGEGITQDPAILAKVFSLRSTGAPTHVAQVTNLNATMGDQAGEIDLAWDSQGRFAQFYKVRYSEDVMPRVWKDWESSKKSSTTVGGLTSGTFYVFQVAAKGTNETGAWSDIARIMAT